MGLYFVDTVSGCAKTPRFQMQDDRERMHFLLVYECMYVPNG